MAGPIGMAVIAGMQKLTCPHCGAVQVRDRALRGKVRCKKCRKMFAVSTGKPRAKAKR